MQASKAFQEDPEKTNKCLISRDLPTQSVASRPLAAQHEQGYMSGVSRSSGR